MKLEELVRKYGYGSELRIVGRIAKTSGYPTFSLTYGDLVRVTIEENVPLYVIRELLANPMQIADIAKARLESASENVRLNLSYIRRI